MAELFPISLDVEETAAGRILKALNKMEGVVKIHLFLSPNRAALPQMERPYLAGAFDSKLSPKLRRNSIEGNLRIIAEVLRKTPAHSRILAAALERFGKDAKNLPQYLYRMKLRKLIARTAPGTYKLTAKGEAFYFDVKDGQSKFHNGKTPDNKNGLRGVILNAIKNENVPVQRLMDLAVQNSYARGGVYGMGHVMKKEGLLTYKSGIYQITSKGLAALSEEAPTKNSKNSHEGLEANG